MEEEWIQVLNELSLRDDINQLLSGYATAILLERGLLKEDEFQRIVDLSCIPWCTCGYRSELV